MSDRQDYKWRPNDNSVQTKLRYELEAKHWTNALKSASVNSTASFSQAFGVVGMIISLLLNIVLFCLICLVDFSVFIRKLFN